MRFDEIAEITEAPLPTVHGNTQCVHESIFAHLTDTAVELETLTALRYCSDEP